MPASPVRTITPERLFTQGEIYESPPLTAGRLEQFSRILVWRLGWPDTGSNVIKVTQIYSPDNGQSWIDFGGFSAVGGIYTLRNGSILQYHTLMTSGFPDADNPQRKIKIRVEALAELTTKIDAETSDTPFLNAQAQVK